MESETPSTTAVVMPLVTQLATQMEMLTASEAASAILTQSVMESETPSAMTLVTPSATVLATVSETRSVFRSPK